MTNILIAVVLTWLCSGQSNMELPLSRCLDAVGDDIREYCSPDVSYMRVPMAYAFDGPCADIPECSFQTLDSPGTALSWGALCYYLGRGLNEYDGRSVSIINNSIGGSPIEAWLPEECLPDYALEELRECRDPDWMAATLYHNAHLYSDWQNAHNALPENTAARWRRIKMFSDWGLEDGKEVFGSHFLKRKFRLGRRQAASEAVLHLGAMRDADSVFVNGHYVGNTTYMYPPRNYKVPAEYLRRGRNVVEIHLYAAENAAGFVPDKEYSLEPAKGRKVNLSKGWLYRPGRRMPRRDPQVFLQYKPSGLYNAMLAPLKGEDIEGVVWYQGESNTGRAGDYAGLLKALISSWRSLFGKPDLPFYIVELAAFEHSELETAETSGWVALQDAQRQVCEEVPGVYLIPNRDLGEWNDIHPQDKKTLGQRLVKTIIENQKP